MKMHVDKESRSSVDLTKTGVYVYANPLLTDILCMAYATSEGEVKIWKLGEEFPSDVAHFISQGGEIHAWNANFEYVMWNQIGVPKYKWPPLPLKQTHCSMAAALAMGLPGKLEKVAPALNLGIEKDMNGSRVMLQLSKPRKVEGDKVTWWEDPTKLETLYAYCKQDVEVERAASKLLNPLSPSEREMWLLDQEINNHGIQIDMKTVKFALEVIEMEKKRLDVAMRKATVNEVSSANASVALTDWLITQGIPAESVAKADVLELLKSDLPKNARKALEVRQEAAKSSTAKLAAMKLRASEDGRVRGIAQYHGAGTGRWSGRGIQTQNFPRPNLKHSQIEKVISLLGERKLSEIDMFYGAPMTVLSDCLRALITAEDGSELITVDFASIEARAIAWLAGEESVLEIFRTHGKVYEHAAAGIYKVPLDKVTKEQRQIGKVAILALGYQGGKVAFQSMAKNYGVVVSDERAEDIKVAWRKANPAIVKYWYALEEAAISAVLNPGEVFSAGPKGREVKYRVLGSFLVCRLPSGRCIYYPYPTLERDMKFNKDCLVYMSEDAMTRRWTKHKGYGGLFAENVTQALSRDILAEALKRLKNKGFKTVMHCHDEIVCEGNQSLEEMEEIMLESPKWAGGLPLAGEGWRGKRYRK